MFKKMTYDEMITLRKSNHAVHGYTRKGLIVVDGFKWFAADKRTCMVANTPDSEFKQIIGEGI